VVGLAPSDRVLDCMYYASVTDKNGVSVGLDPAKFTIDTTIKCFEECALSNSFTVSLGKLSASPVEVCTLNLVLNPVSVVM
jgi:hypothetical protein